jgi:hypothetical protein
LKSLGGALIGVLTALVAANTYPHLTAIFAAIATGLTGWLGLPQPGAKAAAEADLIRRLEKLEAARISSLAPEKSTEAATILPPSSVLLVLMALLAGCGANLSDTQARTAVSLGRSAIAALASVENDPAVVHRIVAADYALASVSQALGKQDVAMVKAAAPCAVEALKALRPDFMLHGAASDSLEAVISALERVGGQCIVQEADEDGGVSLREITNPLDDWREFRVRRTAMV